MILNGLTSCVYSVWAWMNNGCQPTSSMNNNGSTYRFESHLNTLRPRQNSHHLTFPALLFWMTVVFDSNSAEIVSMISGDELTTNHYLNQWWPSLPTCICKKNKVYIVHATKPIMLGWISSFVFRYIDMIACFMCWTKISVIPRNTLFVNDITIISVAVIIF